MFCEVDSESQKDQNHNHQHQGNQAHPKGLEPSDILQHQDSLVPPKSLETLVDSWFGNRVLLES